MADSQHAQQDPRQPAPGLAMVLDASATDADHLHQQTAAGAGNAPGNVPLEAESQQHRRQLTDGSSAAGLPAASKGSMAELEPLLERVTAICEAVKARHPGEPVRESAAEAAGDGAGDPSAPEAVSKVCCCNKQIVDSGNRILHMKLVFLILLNRTSGCHIDEFARRFVQLLLSAESSDRAKNSCCVCIHGSEAVPK